MDVRYQVFVSSTYTDLIEERQKVFQTLMEMDCIPAGMELFPAADDEQWEFIKKIIDDCDYYLLIIGGRYGSTTVEGVSYTEREYEYALEKGIKVMAFLHENPDDIPVGKSELDSKASECLRAFRKKVSEGRLFKFWNFASDLPGLVALSLLKTIKTHPAVGWVRSDKVSSEKLLGELNDVRRENEELRKKLSDSTQTIAPDISDLAPMDEEFLITGTYYADRYNPNKNWSESLSWEKLFGLIEPYLFDDPNDEMVKTRLCRDLFEKTSPGDTLIDIDDQIYQTIKMQFLTLGLVNVDRAGTVAGKMGLFWSFTPKGKALALEIRAVKSQQPALTAPAAE